jgi:hypothetical protein
VWQQKQRKNNKITRPYHKVSEAKHHAETRDPLPRDATRVVKRKVKQTVKQELK